jgi:lysophospholipase L1-like esterase
MAVLGNCAWKRLVSRKEYPALIAQAVPVNMYYRYQEQDYLPLDRHPSAHGHRTIAENLLQALREAGL